MWRVGALAPSDAPRQLTTWRVPAARAGAASGGGQVADDRDVLLLRSLCRRPRQLGPCVVLGPPDRVREARPRAGRVTGRGLLEQAVEPELDVIPRIGRQPLDRLGRLLALRTRHD